MTTEFDLAAVVTSIRKMSQMLAGLKAKELAGWPGDVFGWPTAEEAQAIKSTFHELGLHEPELSEERRWYVAGQIVARTRRDREAS